MMRPVRLEEAGRDGHAELGRERLHRQYGLVLADRLRVGEQPLVLDPAEIFALEQFGGRMTCAPFDAASRTRSETWAMFASISLEKAS